MKKKHPPRAARGVLCMSAQKTQIDGVATPWRAFTLCQPPRRPGRVGGCLTERYQHYILELASNGALYISDTRGDYRQRAFQSRECLRKLENAMAFQSVPNTAEVDMIYTLNGVTVQNVFYAEHPGGYSEANLQALANAVDLAWPATFQPDQNAEVSYVKTEVRGLENQNDFVVESVVSAGVGTKVGVALPNNVTFAIKKTSGKTGRSARGRSYWIGVPKDELEASDENLIKSAYAAQIVADIDFIRSTIDGEGTWEAVLVSRFTNGAARTTGETFPWIGTTNVDLRVDTMRSRLP